MKIKVLVVHFHDGVHAGRGVRQSLSTSGRGGAAKVDDMEATPAGIVVRDGEVTSFVPWGSVKSCPEVEIVPDEKPKGGKS